MFVQSLIRDDAINVAISPALFFIISILLPWGYFDIHMILDLYRPALFIMHFFLLKQMANATWGASGLSKQVPSCNCSTNVLCSELHHLMSYCSYRSEKHRRNFLANLNKSRTFCAVHNNKWAFTMPSKCVRLVLIIS